MIDTETVSSNETLSNDHLRRTYSPEELPEPRSDSHLRFCEMPEISMKHVQISFSPYRVNGQAERLRL